MTDSRPPSAHSIRRTAVRTGLPVLAFVTAMSAVPNTGSRIGGGGTTGFTDVPAWARDAVWYQIFPERFRNGDPANDPTPDDIRGSWPNEEPPRGWTTADWTADWYRPLPWETGETRGFYHYVQQRRYGGDLQGVLDRLDYLRDLGVTAIYFNPLFESPSLHKYDATFYHHIDNNFGPDPEGDRAVWAQENPADPATWRWTAADSLFLRVIREAHARGMKVVIDGVFNHAGPLFWALQDLRSKGERSAYRDWFVVTRWDDPSTPADEFAYQGWAGLAQHPEFREDERGLVAGPREHVHAVVKRWMDPNGDGNPEDGVDGWRLDVAEMVAIPFWKEFRTWVRQINPDAYTVGEVWWEDWPAGKMFNAEPWLRGDVFDGVMNYRWAREVLHFFRDRKNRITAGEFDRRLRLLRAEYRAQATGALMNLMDSHDTDRLASQAVNPDTRYDGDINPRDNPHYDVRKPAADERALQRLIVLFQMTYVGAPGVYYGDEAGMWGADDPDPRKPMLWADMTFEDEATHPLGKPRPRDANAFDRSLFEHYRTMIAIRRAHPALSSGSFETLLTDDERELYAFRRTAGRQHAVVALNASASAHEMQVPPGVGGAAGVWKSAITGRVLAAGPRGISVTLGPRSGEILVLDAQ